ncbi:MULTISPECIES: cytochrome c/FTR1 family iron permease [Shewanella]|uniref:cytochrome c/FTR1 family iron permease n=1 Tax=Shewanella TaxID=22 RepID=UPI001F217D1C|nr:cytochrome c/FTR1 family iron permease [Shewanella psychromarinicola]MCL1081655.1 FTR1 family protein [Shewanella psychromarinicola]
MNTFLSSITLWRQQLTSSVFNKCLLIVISSVFSTSLWAQSPAVTSQEISPETSQDRLKQTRQILQLAEYIGVDYSEAISAGEINNADEFAEMQQFASIIIEKTSLLANDKPNSLMTDALQLQQAIADKSSLDVIQQFSQKIRKQLLSQSPALVLPSQLIAKDNVKQLFIENCSSCHGDLGQGNGPLAKSLSPQPTNFTDQERALNRSLLGLFDAISDGLDGSAMRAFSELNDQQRWSLTFYVGSLAFEPTAVTTKHIKQDANIELQQWVNSNPTQLLQQNVGIDRSQLERLRSQPELLFQHAESPISVTRTNLQAAVKAYQANELAQAQTLAVSAYLDGFELIENNLDAHDSGLRKSIETKLLNFRNLLKTTGQNTLVNQQLSSILTQLNQADTVLTGQSLSNNAMFSAALIILLREGLEALLVIIALMTVLIKTERHDAIKFVHFGWISALAAGVLTWWAADNLISISGASREVMEGGAALLAALVLFYVGYWMHSKTQGSKWQSYLKKNVDRHLNTGTLWGLTGLAFISVYREVFETILFYQSLLTQAIGSASSNEQVTYLAYGLLTGMAILAVIAWLMMRYSVKLPLARFFAVSSYFMLILAFILAGKGISALQEAAIINLTPFPVDVSISWLGIASTWQGLTTQMVIVVLFSFLVIRNREAK